MAPKVRRLLNTDASLRERFISGDKCNPHFTQFQSYLTHGMKRANEEHHWILELGRQRNIPAASDLLSEHIRHAGNSFKGVLEQKRLESQLESQNSARRSKS